MVNSNIMTSSNIQDSSFTEHIFPGSHLLPIQDYINFVKSHPQPPKPIKHIKYKPTAKAIVGLDVIEVPSHHSQYWPLPTNAVKKLVRERDNYTCQICGEWGNVVDHIIPLRISHDSSPENLRVLCQYHNNLTRLPRRDARLDFDTWLKLLQDSLSSEPLSLPPNEPVTKDHCLSPIL